MRVCKKFLEEWEGWTGSAGGVKTCSHKEKD